MESSGPCLLCDEEPFILSPTPSPRRSSSPPPNADEDRDTSLRDILQREHQYAPRRGYLDHLRRSSNLSAAKTRAVCSRLNLATGTAFSAVNYLDRFISMNYVMRWGELDGGAVIGRLPLHCFQDGRGLHSFAVRSPDGGSEPFV
ncbi:hypothetical protein OPV22_021627 [Ensete ventricosum]|uniref:Uncharacterized protein n=1 Tax=Ensete ventricosum TaxID=4639 RepID=A0AAV8QJB0_ENSVE|nr:hypothetical protein OPV22_021627 [Ensete ventricosum]